MNKFEFKVNTKATNLGTSLNVTQQRADEIALLLDDTMNREGTFIKTLSVVSKHLRSVEELVYASFLMGGFFQLTQLDKTHDAPPVIIH